MKWMLTCLLIFASTVQAEKAQSEDQANARAKLNLLMQYQNTFPTLREMLNELKDAGLVNSESIASISDFLKKKNLTLDMKLPKGKAVKNGYSWGTTKLTFEAGGILKTPSGRFLKFPKGTSFDRAFIETANVLTEKKSALNWSLLPYAEADVNDWTGAAAFQASKLVGDLAVLFPIIGCRLSYSISTAIQWARSAAYDGTVSCSGDLYVLTGYGDGSKIRAVAFERGSASANSPEYRSQPFSPHSLLGSEIFGCAKADKSNFRTQESVVIPRPILQKVFPNGQQSCTPENAEKVSVEAKDDLQKLHAELVRYANLIMGVTPEMPKAGSKTVD